MIQHLLARSEPLWLAAEKMLGTAGFRGDISLHPLEGGANNRVYRVDANGMHALLKVYFQHSSDQRDRLGAEFAFASFAWENDVRCVPRPLACDTEHRLGLYEFVNGRSPLPHEVTEEEVRQALNFVAEINRHKGSPEGKTLPVASEACFSIAEHLRCVEKRVQHLKDITEISETDREAIEFVGCDLLRAWDSVVDSVRENALGLGLCLEEEIAQWDRCLSPSDFGFHNAILSEDGRLRFFDFEYAGWDDPAKMTCDFFCQPAVPVSMDFFDVFVEAVAADLSEPEGFLRRVDLLLPVYRLKWCCILLNDFLPSGGERRRFATNVLDWEGRKAGQLLKARDYLQRQVD